MPPKSPNTNEAIPDRSGGQPRASRPAISCEAPWIADASRTAPRVARGTTIQPGRITLTAAPSAPQEQPGGGEAQPQAQGARLEAQRLGQPGGRRGRGAVA